MRYKIFDPAGNLTNTIVANAEFVEQHYPGRYEIIEEPPIPEPVPDVVTPFQAKGALLIQGLLPQVESLIVHPDTDPLVKLAWQTAQEFRRYSPSVLGMAEALGWTGQQLDDLFVLAATLEA
jgi:hypothetical protein